MPGRNDNSAKMGSIVSSQVKKSSLMSTSEWRRKVSRCEQQESQPRDPYIINEQDLGLSANRDNDVNEEITAVIHRHIQAI